MASELFMGPDGGPYVSINENNGDIELKDNSGSVVAKWDESATQWDLVSNDLSAGAIDATSVETTALNNKPLNTGGNIKNRPIVSSEDQTITISPGGEPIADAFTELALLQQHEYVLNLNDGTYDSDVSIDTPISIQNHQKDFVMSGNTTTPSNVVLSFDNFDVGIRGGNNTATKIEGVEFQGSPTNYNSAIEYDQCIFNPTNEANYTGGHGFKTIINDCDFSADVDTNVGINCNQGATTHVNFCRGEVKGHIFEENQNGRVTYNFNNRIIGRYPGTYLYDDFRGHDITSRPSGNHRWAIWYPDYTVLSGSPTIDGQLTLPAGDTTAQRVDPGAHFTLGRHVFRFSLSSSISSGRLLIETKNNSDNKYEIIINSSDIVLRYQDAGTLTTAINASWSNDTNEHVLELVMNNDGTGGYDLELILDGSSLGTANSSFMPVPDDYTIGNESDSEAVFTEFILSDDI